MMRTLITPLLVAVVLAPCGRAQDKNDAAKDRKERIAAVKKELEVAESAMFEKYQKAKDDAERETVLKDRPKGSVYAQKLWPLVTENATDAAAAEALSWMMLISEDAADKKKAGDLLLQHHVQTEAIAEVLRPMSYEPKPANLAFIERVAKDATQPSVRGKAIWAKAQLLGSAVETADTLASASMKPEQRKSYEEYLGAEAVAWLKTLDAKATAAMREQLLEELVAKYGDVKMSRDTLADAAKAELFEIRNLAIGKVAPDIVGKDVDGVQFKLSDYRGKVVVLDFWGEW